MNTTLLSTYVLINKFWIKKKIVKANKKKINLKNVNDYFKGHYSDHHEE